MFSDDFFSRVLRLHSCEAIDISLCYERLKSYFVQREQFFKERPKWVNDLEDLNEVSSIGARTK